MRVLSRASADEVGRKMIGELPRRVLEVVARNEGCTKARLVGDVTRGLPKDIDPEGISGWVDEALGWLIVRGDVEREPRGVYRCVPAYLVEPSDALSSRVRLHGNPRAEAALLKILGTFDARLVHDEARSYSELQREGDARPDLGTVERYIALRPGHVTAALQRCEAEGYGVLRPSEIAATLPRMDQLLTPAEHDLAPLNNPAAGIWNVYDPTVEQQDRWREDDSWASGSARLVRWRPSDDWEGDHSARIYYHGGYGRVAELGVEMRSLWQLYLDRSVGNSRAMWWRSPRLWVPQVIPTATQRWLELLAGMRARPAGLWLRLTISEAAVGVARAELSKTLGLIFRPGYPSREYFGRGRRYGRRQR